MRQWSTDTAEPQDAVIIGLGVRRTKKWVRGVESLITTLDVEVAMILIRAGLGEHLHAAVTELVVLGREGVLVDTDLTGGRLRRKLSAGEPVNVDLTAVRSGSGTGQCRKLGRKLIRVIRESVEVLPFNHS